jgi:serine/threonine protein kinase
MNDPGSAAPVPHAAPAQPSTALDLLDLLRRHELVTVAQLDELSRSASDNADDARALARALVGRGWLTSFQANQVILGRAGQLLLGAYLIEERLGAGGMGEVFRARHRKLGRVVAVKVMRKERLDSADAVRRFRHEIEAAARLNHPNIVLAFDADLVEGTHVFVMEYVEGIDLGRLLNQKGPLPVWQACECVRQAALGLQHAHERGLVHRDVKPSNLLLTADGTTIKVLDMGLARLLRTEEEPGSALTLEGTVMGTVDYMAPEQAEESHTVDIRADVYSLGCTLYHLLTGQAPFPGGSLAQKLRKHQQSEPTPVEQLRPGLPSELPVVLRKMMAKRPEARYQAPSEVATALAALWAPVATAVPASTTAPVLSPAAETASPFTGLRDEQAAGPARGAHRGRRWGLLSAGIGACVLVPLALWLLSGPRQPVVAPAQPEPPRPSPPGRDGRRVEWREDLVRQGKVHAPDLSDSPVSYDVDFRQPRAGFFLGAYAWGECHYRDGVYRVTTRLAAGGLWGFGNLPGNRPGPGGACRFVGRSTGPHSEGWGCYIQREQENEKEKPTLWITLSSAGSCRLHGVVEAELAHPAIKPHGQTNELLWALRGRQLEVYVNGVAIHMPITLDVELTPTLIGIAIRGGPQGGEAELDRITLWAAKDLPRP